MRRTMVVLGRKKLLFSAAMILGVLVPLLVASYNIPVEDVAGQSAKMMNYLSEGEGFSFDYPQGWLIRVEKDYSGGEILENVAFWNSDHSAHGFVQVMKLAKTIPDYVQEARKTMRTGIDSLQFRKTSLNGKEGYILTYKRGRGNARSIAAEYFFEQKGKVFRFSCFYPEALDDEYAKVFTDMLDTFRF